MPRNKWRSSSSRYMVAAWKFSRYTFFSRKLDISKKRFWISVSRHWRHSISQSFEASATSYNHWFHGGLLWWYHLTCRDSQCTTVWARMISLVIGIMKLYFFGYRQIWSLTGRGKGLIRLIRVSSWAASRSCFSPTQPSETTVNLRRAGAFQQSRRSTYPSYETIFSRRQRVGFGRTVSTMYCSGKKLEERSRLVLRSIRSLSVFFAASESAVTQE